MVGLLGSIVENLPGLVSSGVQVYNALNTKAAKTETRAVAHKVIKAQTTGLAPSGPVLGGMGRDWPGPAGQRAIGQAARLFGPGTDGATGSWEEIAQQLGRGAFRGIGGALVERLTRRIEHPRGALVKARTAAPRLSNGMPFAPPGYRLHYEDEAQEYFVAKVRHPNWLNLKALQRAERRTDMFGKIVKRYLRCSHKAHVLCGTGGSRRAYGWKKKRRK